MCAPCLKLGVSFFTWVTVHAALRSSTNSLQRHSVTAIPPYRHSPHHSSHSSQVTHSHITHSLTSPMSTCCTHQPPSPTRPHPPLFTSSRSPSLRPPAHPLHPAAHPTRLTHPSLHPFLCCCFLHPHLPTLIPPCPCACDCASSLLPPPPLQLRLCRRWRPPGVQRGQQRVRGRGRGLHRGHGAVGQHRVGGGGGRQRVGWCRGWVLCFRAHLCVCASSWMEGG